MLWVASPAIAVWISLSPARRAGASRSRLPTRSALRLVARRTWRYFETFVTADDQMLPPDNFQEDPQAGPGTSDLAHQSGPLSPVHRQRP